MSQEPVQSSGGSYPDEIKRFQYAERALAQMRDEIGDVAKYSSQELYDMISFLKEFCVSLEDEAMSKADSLNQPMHDDLPLF